MGGAQVCRADRAERQARPAPQDGGAPRCSTPCARICAPPRAACRAGRTCWPCRGSATTRSSGAWGGRSWRTRARTSGGWCASPSRLTPQLLHVRLGAHARPPRGAGAACRRRRSPAARGRGACGWSGWRGAWRRSWSAGRWPAAMERVGLLRRAPAAGRAQRRGAPAAPSRRLRQAAGLAQLPGRPEARLCPGARCPRERACARCGRWRRARALTSSLPMATSGSQAAGAGKPEDARTAAGAARRAGAPKVQGRHAGRSGLAVLRMPHAHRSRRTRCRCPRPVRLRYGGRVAGGQQTFLRRRGQRGMNRFERLFGLRGEARLRYFDGEFQVLIARRLRALRRHRRADRPHRSALLERGAAGGLCQRRDLVPAPPRRLPGGAPEVGRNKAIAALRRSVRRDASAQCAFALLRPTGTARRNRRGSARRAGPRPAAH